MQEWFVLFRALEAFLNPNIGSRYLEVKLDLITATAALAGFSSILFGFLTNLPVALA